MVRAYVFSQFFESRIAKQNQLIALTTEYSDLHSVEPAGSEPARGTVAPGFL